MHTRAFGELLTVQTCLEMAMRPFRLRVHESTREQSSKYLVSRLLNPSQTSEPNKSSLAFILWPLDEVSGVQEPQQGDATASEVSTRNTRKRFCTIEGCTKRAKFHRKCWHHGGSIKCVANNCTNRAKTRGLCWSHGGGKLCSVGKCQTIAVSNGICWAHGGGKRCQVLGCARPAYANNENLCKIHNREQQQRQYRR